MQLFHRTNPSLAFKSHIDLLQTVLHIGANLEQTKPERLNHGLSGINNHFKQMNQDISGLNKGIKTQQKENKENLNTSESLDVSDVKKLKLYQKPFSLAQN